ncbi:MAG TPA: cytochrome P450 [Microthrixaceae bacterium]|nr:cytochrome P450 [Microthrixaceae bacterium]
MDGNAAPGEKDSGTATVENYDVLADLYDLANPQPKYRALIERGGALCPVEGVAVLASREAVETALRDPATFSSEGFLDLGNIRPLIPLSVDPPKHVKYRKILDPLFAPRRMDEAEADITERFNHFVDAFVDRGSCHFTDELATPFPSAIFLGLMGLPWDELDTLLGFKDGILRPDPTAPSEQQAALRRATGTEIYAYFDAILDQRSSDPRDDILTRFLNTEIDGERLTREEILDICFLFLIAGLDTVTDSLTCMFAFLAQHPDHRRQLVEDPSVIPAAIEEMLRWETPVTQVPRMATRDTELAGCPIKQGSFVSVMVGAANVDPADLPDGDVVRFDREVNRHLAFGGGVHRCLGSHLARRELRVALQEWHRRIPDYELKPGLELQYPTGLRSVENLELVW